MVDRIQRPKQNKRDVPKLQLGCGSVRAEARIGHQVKVLELRNCLYVPSRGPNRLSLPCLEKAGGTTEIEGRKITLFGSTLTPICEGTLLDHMALGPVYRLRMHVKPERTSVNH